MAKKEFDFYTHPIDSFLFVDIETVSKVPELMEGTPLYDAFVYKMRYAEEAQRKDFNAYNVKALYAEKAALYPEFGKIVAITVGKIVEGHKLTLRTYSGDDEAQILTRFFKVLNNQLAHNPDIVLCGINLKFFDLRYCFIRAVVHQIEPVKGHINLTGMKPWEIRTCDLTEIWKQTSMYNAPLIAIAECLGLPSPKSDLDGSQVSTTYWKEGKEGLDKIVKYCEQDVFTTANVTMKLRFADLLTLDDRKGSPDKESIENEQLPPILTRSFNTGELTPEIEEELIKKTRRASKVERERLLDIVSAIQGRTPIDEGFVAKVMAK